MREFKIYRERTGMNQHLVGHFLGVSNTTVCMWETENALPRAELLPKIAALYNCTVDELLGVGTDASILAEQLE